MWELFMNIIKSGFPLLWLIVVGMILRAIWLEEGRSRAYKQRWSLIVAAPLLLSALLWIALALWPVDQPVALLVLAGIIFCAPIVGVGLWLFLGR
ncbi:MAG: hypothetical protein D6730_13845 [Bacteroidetes bacterium]|nr:MAG: hypothetical protein D6730_13845 [Bacteroidota bacterium]